MNDLVGWPKHWPRYRQACYSSEDDYCDVLEGPCKCGAWHKKDEFELKDDGLYRYGKKVAERYIVI